MVSSWKWLSLAILLIVANCNSMGGYQNIPPEELQELREVEEFALVREKVEDHYR